MIRSGCAFVPEPTRAAPCTVDVVPELVDTGGSVTGRNSGRCLVPVRLLELAFPENETVLRHP